MHPVEVQLRSDAMHEEAEYGVASHWLYKDTRGKGFAMLKAHVDWLKSLAALHADIKGDEKALDSIKLDIFGDRIYVLTPRGDVKELPTGATTLDFAYAVHTDIGHRCILAKVNGKPVSFDTELENGDTIEIVTRKDGVPKLEWLSIVKTSQAKVKIKNWFAAQDRQKNVKRGRDQLNTQLARFGKPLLAPSLNILKGFGGGKLNSTEREKILEEIGKGTQSASNVIRKLFEYYDLLEDKKYEIMREKKDKKVEARAKAKAKDLDDSVILGGVTGMKSNFAKCCNPSSGDDIVGYVSSLKDSATVHKRECPILAGLNPERVVSAHFKGADGRKRGQLYRVRVRIEADERIGLLGDVGSTVAANGVNIVSYGPLDSGKAGIAWVLLELDVGDLEQFEKALNSIERVSGVRSVIKVT
jgi:GTP pyrophosphokinase